MGGIVTALPDLLALAWIQSRMVFFLAAAHGLDPRDPMRPAELLHLMELYPDPASARDALDGAGTPLAQAYVGSRLRRDEALAKQLLKMVSRGAGKRLSGRLVPVVGIAVNAVANERDTRALADRAIAFYTGVTPGSPRR